MRSILFFVFIFNFSALAQDFEIPDDCSFFESEEPEFCTEVGFGQTAAQGLIQISLYAKVMATDPDEREPGDNLFSTGQEVVDAYLDFESWDEKHSSGTPRILISDKLNSVLVNGEEIIRHHFKYRLNAPIMGSILVEERDLYREVEVPDASFFKSFSFNLDPAFAATGVTHRFGQLHVKEVKDEDEGDHFLLFFYINVSPSIDLLLGQSATEVERAVANLFRAIYDN